MILLNCYFVLHKSNLIFIRNDPLFPPECQEHMQDIYERNRRYGEDE